MRAKAKLIFILGGARSGKSTYARRLAETLFQKPLFLATAEATDKEMARRIKRHRKDRGKRWLCDEAPLNVARVLLRPPPSCDGILLDCLTVWLGNVLVKEGRRATPKRIRELIAALTKPQRDVIVVANEVGMGIVPDNELARVFRDLAGELNQRIAAKADTVVFVAAGLCTVLKGQIELKENGDRSRDRREVTAAPVE